MLVRGLVYSQLGPPPAQRHHVFEGEARVKEILWTALPSQDIQRCLSVGVTGFLSSLVYPLPLLVYPGE